METNNNSYIHANSVIKAECRSTILANVMRMFPKSKNKVLNTFTLGGEEMKMELLLERFYKLKGVSYEFEPTSVATAKRNAPQGIEVIEGNIFNHVYKGTEQLIWFDFMTALRHKNIKMLLDWITLNQLTNDCVFVVTYTLHSRESGEGIKQLFDTEEKHESHIQEMMYYIGCSLENDYVKVKGNPIVTRYCNVDVSKASLPMVQFLFNISKK